MRGWENESSFFDESHQSSVENGDGDVGAELHQDEFSPEHVDHQIGGVLGSSGDVLHA